MKKVLFIIQSYPSNRSANVLCDTKIIKEMQKTGKYDIHCLVYRFHGQPKYEEIDGLKIHRFQRSKWWDIYTYARDHESRFFYKAIVKLNRMYMRFRQFFCIPIYPNYEPLLAKLAAKEAVKLHEREGFDIVVAEHSGRDTLYAGKKLKEFDPHIKSVALLWDPLSGRAPAKYLPISYAQRKINMDEDMLLSPYDVLCCLKSNQKYLTEHSSEKKFFNKVHFLDIPGIIPPNIKVIAEGFTQTGKINLLYSGILYLPDRDPSTLIETLNRSKYAESIHLMFFSVGEDGIAKAKKTLANFKGTYLIHPYIEKIKLDSVAYNCDILINLGGSNPRMVPSKIFEYMALGKPIISTYYIDDEASTSYLSSYPLSLCIDIRKPLNTNIQQLDCFISNCIGKEVSFDEVKKTFPLNTPQEYIKLIDSL